MPTGIADNMFFFYLSRYPWLQNNKNAIEIYWHVVFISFLLLLLK